MKILALDHVAIHVKDLEASCRFYSEVLLAQSLPRPAFDFPGAWFRLGANQELHLIGGRNQAVFSHNRGNHFALETDDLAGWERHFEKIGFQHSPRKLRPDGAGQIFLADPDGHVIELCAKSGIPKTNA
ncbi:MAG TPA: VOC family protein [Verrucomicrobiae bacterium]|nr:VOC family protein [Verrucomicrobiae bacterium]